MYNIYYILFIYHIFLRSYIVGGLNLEWRSQLILLFMISRCGLKPPLRIGFEPKWVWWGYKCPIAGGSSGGLSSVVVTRAHGMITPELSIWITRETKFSNFFALPSWGPDLLDGVCGSRLSYPQGMVNEEITCL